MMNMDKTLPLFTPVRLVALAAAALLAGCALGPEYAGPPDAAPQAQRSGQFVRAGDLANATAPLNRWWEALNDAQLNRLEREAITTPPLDVSESPPGAEPGTQERHRDRRDRRINRRLPERWGACDGC